MAESVDGLAGALQSVREATDRVTAAEREESRVRGESVNARNKAEEVLRESTRGFALAVRPLVVELGGLRHDNGLAKRLVDLFAKTLDQGETR